MLQVALASKDGSEMCVRAQLPVVMAGLLGSNLLTLVCSKLPLKTICEELWHGGSRWSKIPEAALKVELQRGV